MEAGGAHVFVDESKERGYILAAVWVRPSDLAVARQGVRTLILPRQRRLHFKRESDARRSQITKVILDLGLRAVVYDAGAADEKEARRACLTALVADMAAAAAHRVVLERDDSVIDFDRRLIYRQIRSADRATDLRYDHLRAHEECLLAIPDAIAWCWAKGGRWRARIQPVVSRVQEV